MDQANPIEPNGSKKSESKWSNEKNKMAGAASIPNTQHCAAFARKAVTQNRRSNSKRFKFKVRGNKSHRKSREPLSVYGRTSNSRIWWEKSGLVFMLCHFKDRTQSRRALAEDLGRSWRILLSACHSPGASYLWRVLSRSDRSWGHKLAVEHTAVRRRKPWLHKKCWVRRRALPCLRWP